mmetsp:Transcript_26474/g.47963  ORF Transcript_26474/g.47963 Transcript_26474/m.47963 type:complete len:86 (+) Transcript_26474:1409-1666(+)
MHVQPREQQCFGVWPQGETDGRSIDPIRSVSCGGRAFQSQCKYGSVVFICEVIDSFSLDTGELSNNFPLLFPVEFKASRKRGSKP